MNTKSKTRYQAAAYIIVALTVSCTPQHSFANSTTTQTSQSDSSYSLIQSLKNYQETTKRIPKEPQRVYPPAIWQQMKLGYTNSLPPNENLKRTWAAVKKMSLRYRKHAIPILYRTYRYENGIITIIITDNKNCSQGTIDPKPGTSRITKCNAYIMLEEKHRKPKIKTPNLCFEWNGQAPPGSPNDPQTNSDYTRFNEKIKRLKIFTIKQGKIIKECSHTYTIQNQ